MNLNALQATPAIAGGLPACLGGWLVACSLACLLAYLPAYLHACLHACLPACLLVCLFSCWLACLLACESLHVVPCCCCLPVESVPFLHQKRAWKLHPLPPPGTIANCRDVALLIRPAARASTGPRVQNLESRRPQMHLATSGLCLGRPGAFWKFVGTVCCALLH